VDAGGEEGGGLQLTDLVIDFVEEARVEGET
jgi:hypothetical protein